MRARWSRKTTDSYLMKRRKAPSDAQDRPKDKVQQAPSDAKVQGGIKDRTRNQW